jgi:tellurite resistance protein
MTLILLFSFLVAAGLSVAYSLSPASKARKKVRSAVALLGALDREVGEQKQSLQNAVSLTARAYIDEIRAGRLRAIPLDVLKRHGSGMRLQALKDAGIQNLADLQGWSSRRLEQLRGVGPRSAGMIAQIVSSLTSQSNSLAIPHPTIPIVLDKDRALYRAIYCLGSFESQIPGQYQKLRASIEDFTARQEHINSRIKFTKWLPGFGASESVKDAIAGAESLAGELTAGHPTANLCSGLSESLAKVKSLSASPIDTQAIIEDLKTNQAHYTSVLTSHLGAPGAPNLREAVTFRQATGAATNPVPVPLAHVQSPIQTPPGSTAAIPKPHQFVIPRPTIPAMSECWVASGRDVTVQGFLIRGGMVYLSSRSVAASGAPGEPSLIDPGKPIAKSTANCHIRHTSYWPSYDQITPEARASYLHWLSTGKCDPDADVGYVFIYFYGLERRALIDIESDPKAKPDLPQIEDELRRLLGIYGKQGSFRSYARSLLDFLAARKGESLRPESLLLAINRSQANFSLDLKVALGQLSREARALSADLALAWYLSAPDIPVGQSWRMCPDEFAKLFKVQFGKKFPQGIKLPANKTRIKVTHRAASASLAGQNFSAELDLPDVTVLRRTLASLIEVGDACNSSLASYCRLINTDPGMNDRLEATLQLPVCLWPEVKCKGLEDLKSSIKEDSVSGVKSLKELLPSLPHGGELSRDIFRAFARRLSEMELGLEPDLRYGGDLPTLGDSVVLFDMAGPASDSAISGGFASAALILQMASTVASADSSFDEAESAVMLHHIHNELGLPIVERNRLAARLRLYRLSPPNSTGLKRRIEALDITTRENISDFLVQVALADGVISPSEVKILEGFFKLMGLDNSSLYGKLNNRKSQSGSASPLVEMPATFKIPAAKSSDPNGMHLDLAKVALLRADTARVSALLGTVFLDESEEEPAFSPIADPQTSSEPTLLGLDIEHAALLKVLLERSEWSRAEVEELCADRGLMTDGAIERINDAAFQQFDCALLEGEDTIEVNCQLIAQPSPEEVA